MKTMIALFVTALMTAQVLASGPSASPKSDPQNEQHVIYPKSPDTVEKSSEDEWRLWYIAKGTRSEGLHGALCVNGKWLIGEKAGETITCSLGVFVWSGDWDNRKKMWDKSGWLTKSLEKTYPSGKK